MQLPLVLKALTGQVTLTGLYSFEFVDKSRNTITEIFFMIPPKHKEMTESTRSSTNPTLTGGYNTDAGNATKSVTLSGELFFPYVGSSDNPVARDNAGLENLIDGMTEFFKLRYMLIRYRDYTLTRNARVDIPSAIMNSSPEIGVLYKKVAKLVNEKLGALYDEIQVIFHDYDMDDHFYCRVASFTASQTDTKYLAIEYTINIECYEKDNRQTAQTVEIKEGLNESVDITNTQIQDLDFETAFDDIQTQIGYNTALVNAGNNINVSIGNLDTENTNIQSGTKTPIDSLPIIITGLLNNIETAKTAYIASFLTAAQQEDYDDGTLTLDEIVDIDLLSFFNKCEKIRIFAEGLQGLINATVKKDTIRYYANADDFTLTEEQFEEDGAGRILNDNTYIYYTVLDGDTARTVALRILKDSEKYLSILRVNSIMESDFIDGTLIGQKILIPIDVSVFSRYSNNLVYESDDSDLNRFIHGSDIALDINKNMQLSATGDILGQSGIQVTYDSLINRLSSKKGTLNVFSPNWGLISIGDGNAPLMVRVSRYLSDLVNQVQSDPRVESIQIDMKQLNLEGERLEVSGTINFMGDESREINV